MKIRLCLIGIAIVWFCFPYIRCFLKRMSLLFKIKRVCQKKGYCLCKTHLFWFLGGKKGKNCDCMIETEEERFAVKLFGIPRRRRVLVFMENKEFFIRRSLLLVGIFGNGCLRIWEAFDGKAKSFPEYEFSLDDKATPNDKVLRRILLVNPVPMDMLRQVENGMEIVVSPGDVVYGMEIASLSWLLKQLIM